MAPSETGLSTISKYQKPTWANTMEYLVSCIAMSVGLGNFWRFPYICYENGGGAFLIPYIIVLILLGRPMYYLDMAMGQYCGRGSIYMYLKLAPAWLGIGITQTLCNMAVVSYYAMILAVAGFYMVHSFTFNLPWETCLPEWGDGCIERTKEVNPNVSDQAQSSAQFYFDKKVLLTFESLDDGIGTPNWKLCLFLGIIWTSACINVMLGIRGYGKIAYFFVLFPYVVIIALLANICMMPGAWNGIMFLVTPTWSKILLPKSWLSAVTQCFFSLNIGTGTISMYSSYSNIHHKIDMAVVVVAVVDTLTSLLCSLTVFAGIGNLAHRTKVPIENVYNGDTLSLGFVSYPDAISSFRTVPYVRYTNELINIIEEVFSIVFFFMLIILGLGSLCAYMQVITTNLLEVTNIKVWQSSLIISIYGFISGIVYTTPGGFAIITLVDLFGNVYILTVLGFLQVVLIVYFYGLHKWCWNIEYMIRKRINWYWRCTWAITCPIVLIIICISSCFADVTPLHHNRPYPLMALVSAYILLIIILIPIPLTIIITLIVYRRLFRSNKKAREEAFTTRNWFPDNEEIAQEIVQFNEEKADNQRETIHIEFKLK